MINCNHLVSELHTVKTAILNVKKEYLDPYIINPSDLKNLLNKINSELHKEKSNLQISNSHIDTYYYCYNTKTIKITRIAEEFIFIIDVALTHNQQPFRLYEIINFPVPIPNSPHTSEIIDLPPSVYCIFKK